MSQKDVLTMAKTYTQDQLIDMGVSTSKKIETAKQALKDLKKEQRQLEMALAKRMVLERHAEESGDQSGLELDPETTEETDED